MSLVIFAEFFCAAFILVGFLTRFASIPLIIAMSVALFYSHNADFLAKVKRLLYFYADILLYYSRAREMSASIAL